MYKYQLIEGNYIVIDSGKNFPMYLIAARRAPCRFSSRLERIFLKSTTPSLSQLCRKILPK